jgi:AP-5 complex subunit zeta-1
MHCWFSSVITVDFNSFAPLSLFGHPVLVVALEKVERSSGTLIGSSIATIQKSAAPEVIFRMYSRSYE